MEVGPKQDLVGKLTEAARRRGLKMGVYYSFFEWYNPLWLADRPRFVREHMQPQLRNLITHYKPDVLWADGEWDGPASLWHSREFLTWLFNESPVPEIVVNDRWGQECRHKHGGFYTTEFTPGMKDGSHPWEENRTVTRPRAYDAEDRPLWFDWVFNRQLTLEKYYSARELVLTLVDTVSRGGNLLLNVGPTPDGSLRVIEEERLTQIGDWLKVNGEAIFGTRPWVRNCQWSRRRRAEDRVWPRVAVQVRHCRHRRQAQRRAHHRRGVLYRQGGHALCDSAPVAFPAGDAQRHSSFRADRRDDPRVGETLEVGACRGRLGGGSSAIVRRRAALRTCVYDQIDASRGDITTMNARTDR